MTSARWPRVQSCANMADNARSAAGTAPCTHGTPCKEGCQPNKRHSHPPRPTMHAQSGHAPTPQRPLTTPSPNGKRRAPATPKQIASMDPPNPQRKEQELAQGTPENTSHPVNLAPETAPMQKSQTQAHNFYYSRHAPRHLPTPTCATFPTNFVVTYHGR